MFQQLGQRRSVFTNLIDMLFYTCSQQQKVTLKFNVLGYLLRFVMIEDI
jgi:hypothetical protein